MKATFSEKIAKKNFGGHDNFLEHEVFLLQNKYNLFYHKLEAKRLHVKQFSQKKQYFLGQRQKFAGTPDHFVGRGAFYTKN